MRPGYIIKLLRTAEGLSQSQLAKELNVSNSYLSLLESEKKQPSLPLLEKVASFFQIPLPLLFVQGEDDDSDVLKELQTILSTLLSAKIHARKSKNNQIA